MSPPQGFIGQTFGVKRSPSLLRAAQAIIAPTNGSDLWHETWPLRNPISAGRRRNGRSVSRSRYAPGPHSRHQDSSSSTDCQFGAARAFRARGAHHLLAAASAYLRAARYWARSCHTSTSWSWSILEGETLADRAAKRRTVADRGAEHRDPDRGRARQSAWRRHCSPRPEARQRDAHQVGGQAA